MSAQLQTQTKASSKSSDALSANNSVKQHFSSQRGFSAEMDRYPIQAKLKIGQPGDKYEQEADQVADQVIRMPESRVKDGVVLTRHTIVPCVQRLCIENGEEMFQQTFGENSPETGSSGGEEQSPSTTREQCCRYRRLYIAQEEYRPVSVEGQSYVVKYAKIAFEMEDGADPRQCVLVNWNKGCKYEIYQDSVNFSMVVHHLGGYHPWRFPTWSVDSWDPDPVFWSDRGPTRWNYTQEGNNIYYMEDRPGACGHPNVHAVQFKTCIYCRNDVPATTDTAGSNISTPFECVEWEDSSRWQDPSTVLHPSLPDRNCNVT